MGDNSFYKDYVQNLPLDLQHYAPMFNDIEKEELMGSTYTMEKISMRKASDINDFKLLMMANPEMDKQVTYNEFLRGKILALTRSYDLAFTDGNIRQALVPFLEFGAINYGEANVKCM